MNKNSIAFSEEQHSFLKDMIGKNFNKISCNKFVYSNSVYGIIGLYIDDKIYRLTNFVEVLDYYGKMEDIAVFKLSESHEAEIVSAVKDEPMNDILLNRVIKEIKLVDENQA